MAFPHTTLNARYIRPILVDVSGPTRLLNSAAAWKTRSRLSDVGATVIVVDDGQQLRALVASMRLDPYCSGNHQFVGVVDANALLSCVGNDCRKGPGWQSDLLRMTKRGIATLYASDHVYFEVYEHLPKIARWSKVPVGVLRARFEANYLPRLRFVTVSTTDVVDPQVLAISDPDDVPTGQLAKLVAPCVVFSEDRHLRKPGLAPEDWRAVTGRAIDLIEAAANQYELARTANHGISLPLTGAIELCKFVGRRTGLSPWVIAGVAGVGVALYLKSPERRKTAGKYVVPVIQTLGQEMNSAALQEQRGLRGLREVMLPGTMQPSVKQQTAIILARQREPMLAREVQERMLPHFTSELIPTVAEVRNVLKDSSEFVQPERYRWQFGRLAGPWRG